MTFIGCGQLDLALIDDVQYDWCDVFAYVDLDECGERKLPAIMSAVFSLGKSILEEAITERIGYLEDTQETYGISEEQEIELNELKELDPYEDFLGITITLIRTSPALITRLPMKNTWRKNLQTLLTELDLRWSSDKQDIQN